MIYNVLMGTLNPTHSLTMYSVPCQVVMVERYYTVFAVVIRDVGFPRQTAHT